MNCKINCDNQTLSKENIQQMVTDNDVVFLVFHSHTCGHCKDLLRGTGFTDKDINGRMKDYVITLEDDNTSVFFIPYPSKISISYLKQFQVAVLPAVLIFVGGEYRGNLSSLEQGPNPMLDGTGLGEVGRDEFIRLLNTIRTDPVIDV